jgi:outer membrane lipoprotein-sorting protein
MNLKRNSLIIPVSKPTSGFLFWTFWLLLLTPSFSSNAQEKENSELKTVFEQMDKISKNFQSFNANLIQKKYVAILAEFDQTETGEFFYARSKDGSALIRQDISSPRRMILTLKGELATVYHPVGKQARIVSLGKNKDKAEYLATGIGQSPQKMQETFFVTYQGNETVNGVPCSVLLLRPRDKKAASLYSSITMWVQKLSGIPVQTKFQEANKDYVLMTFSDIKLNVKIPLSKFEQKLPDGIDIQKF